MGGGAFASIKKLKATYAVLQSVSPELFPLEWDALFFSIHSRNLNTELQSLILETCEIREALWGPPGQPFHHLYFLTQRGYGSLENLPELAQHEPWFSDFLLWSLLPAKFATYWSYLLELRTYVEWPHDRTKVCYLPLEDLEGEERTRMVKRIGQLARTLSSKGIHPLKLGNLSQNLDNNLYIFLPFHFGPVEQERFLAFYDDFRYKGYIKVCAAKDKSCLKVQVEPKSIRAIYDYAHLTLAETAMSCRKLSFGQSNYEELIQSYCQLYSNISRCESSAADYYYVQERAKKMRVFYERTADTIKQVVIDKSKAFLGVLRDYYDLAEWRFNDIMETLERLATLSQAYPITLLCEPFEMAGYLNNVAVRDHTLIGLEFSKEFLHAYSKKFGHGLPSGELQHIYHFVQPIEALKAIHNDEAPSLLSGGPIVGEY